MSQLVKFGNNKIKYLSEFLKEKSPKHVFLVTGKKSYYDSGAQNELIPILSEYQHTRFFDFEENPKIEDVERGVQIFNKNKCDLIIVVGGGSVIDMGKLINFFHTKNSPYFQHFNDELKKEEVVSLVAIPTTAGTGSEATHFAVVYYNSDKYSIANQLLEPNFVIINPCYTYNINAYHTAVTGLDALSQAIESYWSVGSTIESRAYSKKAILLVWENLIAAVKLNDRNAKDRLSEAAYFAGKAINITKTTGPHAVSYPFTSEFNIPHGHAVALTLSYFLGFNYDVQEDDCNDKRGVEYVKSGIDDILNLIGCDDINKGVDELQNFILNNDIELSLRKIGVPKTLIKESIINKINFERANNNPRIINKKNLEEYLLKQYF